MDHAGHRERLRRRFGQEGLNGFAPHEALELLLTYALPRVDTNGLAHALIRRFGSLGAVLEASQADLTQVEGIGPRAAALITLMLPLFRMYQQEKLKPRLCLDNYGGLSAYSRKLLRDTGKKLVISEDDFAEGTKRDPSWKDSGIEIMDEDDADALFNQGAEDTMVSYVVAPTDPKKGAVCYKMVISADTHELCYFEKHTIKGNTPAGFLPFDLKIISLQRKK